MPSQAANAANLRADGFKPRLYLSDMSGSVTATCSVDITPEDGALELTVTLLTGTIFAIAFPGMRIDVHSAGGDYKGTISVGYRGFTSATVIQIRELSPGEVPIVAGDILTIYDGLIPVDMLVSATLTFEPDSDPYVDQTDLYRPLCNSGGANVGWLRGGVFDSPFYGSPSVPVDPDSGTPVTHVWTGTGSPSFTVGNSLSADPTMRWTSAGKKLVRHIVTDPDNGTNSSQWMQVRIHDDNDPPYEIVLSTPPSGNPESGFSFAFTLFDNPSIAGLRDGAHVILWSDDTIAGGVAFGSKVPGRSHIVAEGYLRRDTGDLGSGVNEVVFEVISPITKLAELPGFSKVFQRNQTPDDWSKWKSLTMFRAIYGLLVKYSNIGQIFDIALDGFDDANYPLLYLQKQNPFAQTEEAAKSRAGRLTCDRIGRLEIQGELWDVPLDARAAITKTFTFTAADFVPPLVLKRDHVRPLETFRLRGFLEGTSPVTEDGTTAPVFARYPSTPARGGQVTIEERAVIDVSGDNAIFARCSRAAAWANADYYNSDDRSAAWQHAPELTATFPLVYARMFQNYREYCGFNGTAVDALGRQVNLSLFDWIPMSISEDYDASTCKVVFRAATYAPAFMSVDDTPAAEDYVPPEVLPPADIPPSTTPRPDPDGLKPGLQTAAIFMADNSVQITHNLNRSAALGSPTFTGIDLTALPNWGGGTLQDATVRADSPLYLGTGSQVNGNICMTTSVQKFTDLFGSVALSAATTLAGSTSLKTMQFERGDPLWGIIIWYTYAGGVLGKYTTNGGGSWSNCSGLTTDYDTTAGTTIPPGLWLSPSGNGEALVTVYTSTATGGSLTAALYRTTNYGASFALVSSPAVNTGNLLAASLSAGFTDTNTFYYAKSNGAIASYDPRLMRVTGSGTPVDISPDIAGEKYAPHAYNRAISVSDDDANTVVLAGLADYGGAGARATFRTFNAKAAAPTWTQLTSTNIANNRRVYVVNRQTYYMLGVSRFLAVVSNGLTVDERGANLPNAEACAIVGG